MLHKVYTLFLFTCSSFCTSPSYAEFRSVCTTSNPKYSAAFSNAGCMDRGASISGFVICGLYFLAISLQHGKKIVSRNNRATGQEFKFQSSQL